MRLFSLQTTALAVALFLFGLSSDSSAQSCTGLSTGVARVVTELETLGYSVLCGSVSFPVTAQGTCSNSAIFSPNPSSCYGSYSLPPRKGGASSPIYKLDNDEAVIYLGETPPSSYYFGFQSYVFARYNPLATGSESTYDDLFASVGPAINQRTVSALQTRTSDFEQMFSEYTTFISTANQKTASDFESIALPYLFSSSPQSAAVQAAHAITNLEMLPVDLIQLGTTGNSDLLDTLIRLTPFTTTSGAFNSAAVQYMRSPGAVVLRVSPTTPRTNAPPSQYYTLADDPMPATKIQSGVVWEEQLFAAAGVANGNQALQTVISNVIADRALQGLTLQGQLSLNSGVTALTSVQGRTCLSDFEAALATGNPSAVAQSPHCAADSPDADYVGMASSALELASNGSEIVVVGVNHGTLGSATYSNVVIQDPSSSAAGLTNLDLNGSATPYTAGFPTGSSSDFYVASIRASCSGATYCMTAPTATPLELAERVYLAPLTGTKPDYTDVIYPVVLIFSQ